ncbi:MAG: Crp/Fnr family transcriptional regulator [Sulfitobacter sp.]
MSSLFAGNNIDTPLSVAAAVRSTLLRCSLPPVAFDRGVDIQHEGDRADFLYLVKSGFLYSYGVLPDGQRQIIFLYKEGDMVGFTDLGSARTLGALRSLSDCVLQPIPMSAFLSPSFLTPAIATYFLHKAAEMQSVLVRSLVAMGRMTARERVICLLLMLNDRFGSTTDKDEVQIPLNQSELGDLIGLTNVSISKNLSQLSAEGLIERKGNRIVLRRRVDMQRMIGYEPIHFPPDVLTHGARRNHNAVNRIRSRRIKMPSSSARVAQDRIDQLKGWDG